MAIIRMAAPLGATLIALAAIVPTSSQAQGPGAPLELVPGPKQAKPPAKTAIKSAIKTATKEASRRSPRPNAAAAQPAPKAMRANARAATPAVASDRRPTGPHAPLARYAHPQPPIRAAVVPYLAVSRPVLRRGTREAPVIARGPVVNVRQDRVIRGGDSVSLVGMLPWWRNDRMQAVTYGSAEAESKVLEAAAVWLAAHGTFADNDRAASDPRFAAVQEAIEVADASELNVIDRAAQSVPPPPMSPTFMQSLLTLLGGAAAAAVAASARLLIKR